MEDILPIALIFGTPFAAMALAAFIYYLKHQAKMLDKRLALQGVDSQIQAEIGALRQELAALRDTSTQYDVSIQHNLEELHRRMARVENRTGIAADSPTSVEEPARLTLS